MSDISMRKHLLSTIYIIIFKEIFPVNIGYAAHADKINNYSRQRKAKGFHYDDYSYLKLHIDDAIDAPDFDINVKEGSFHNWMNGISSPKYLITINSILEYTIEICNDKGKYNLLKERILLILNSVEFEEYTGALLKDRVDTWILQIEENDKETLLRATKEVLYMLKNKDRFLPYLLKEEPVYSISNNIVMEMSGTLNAGRMPVPADEKSSKRRYTKLKWIPVFVFLILIPLTYELTHTHQQHDKSGQVWTGPPTVTEAVSSDISNRNTVSEQDTAAYITAGPQMENATSELAYTADKVSEPEASGSNTGEASQSSAQSVKKAVDANTAGSQKDSLSPAPGKADSKGDSLLPSSDSSVVSLSAPEITSPQEESQFHVSDINVQWKVVDSADSYSVVVKDTIVWENIYEKTDIFGNSILLDKSLFKAGRNYRIYLHSVKGQQYSTPNYVDISFEELIPPQITAPDTETLLPLSDIGIQWEPVDMASSYNMLVTDTKSWITIFTKEDITDHFIVLDQALFKPGGSYRIYVHSVMDSIQSVPSYIDIAIENLLSPEITAPLIGSSFPASDINVQWEPVEFATGYTIALVDMSSWTNIFTKTNITDNSIILDKSLFSGSGSYRIYLISAGEDVESAPSYIDIYITK